MSLHLNFLSSGSGFLRQRYSLTTIVIGSVITFTTVILLLSIYPHAYPTYHRPLRQKVGNPATNRVLLLLPKDLKGTSDYGFQGDWLEKAISNRKGYADYHGYKFMWANLANYKEVFDIHPQWAKIAGLHDAFDKHPDVEWIWCLDSDAIIMNSTINLWDYLLSPEAMIREVKSQGEIKFGGTKQLPQHDRTVKTPKYVEPENIYLIISTDTNGLNTGSFFVRRNAFMSAFIDLWHDPYLIRNKFTFNEQDGLAHLIISHPHVTKHVGIVNRSLINVYPSDYKENDFVVHFAGCRTSDKDCDKLFRDFWNRRTVIDTEEVVPRLRR